MQGAISSIQAVERWFRSNEAPFYTISYYSTSSPTGQGMVISRNIKEADMDAAWNRLQSLILDQTGFGRAQLNLIVYDKPTGYNTPSGRTNIDITTAPQAGSNGPSIGMLPAGYVDESKIQAILDERERLWTLKRENEELKSALENPGDFWAKGAEFFERIGSTPLGAVLIAKIMGTPLQQIPQPVNGIQERANPGNPDSEVEDVEDELEDLEKVAASHGLSLKEFLAKTVSMAQQQPGVVSMLINQ